ncbi:MAG: hypothetical protein WC205_19290, partial [Opitutaceae bacterium]
MKKSLLVIIVGVLLVGGAFMVFQSRTASTPAPAVPPVTADETTTTTSSSASLSFDSTNSAADTKSSTGETTGKTAVVAPTPAKPVTTLQGLYKAFDVISAAATDTSPESLATLISYAAMENPDIRPAAIDALIRRGDTSAAAQLRAAAKNMENPRDAVTLLDAADYLELPPANLKAIASRAKATEVTIPGKKSHG